MQVTASESVLQRVNIVTRRKESLPTHWPIALRDAGLWSGIRLERWIFPASTCLETEECQLLSHCLRLCEGGTSQADCYWRGERRSHVFKKPGDAAVFPAGRTFSGLNSTRGHTKTQDLVMLGIDPQLVQRINTA